MSALLTAGKWAGFVYLSIAVVAFVVLAAYGRARSLRDFGWALLLGIGWIVIPAALIAEARRDKGGR